MKRLLLMRHGKSDWNVDVGDYDRPLNSRGTAAARDMGRALTQMGAAPDHVISSSAVRAATTAALVTEVGQWHLDVVSTPALYGASVKEALEVTGNTPQDAQSVMLVGHQPTWGDLIAHLTGGSVAVKTATVAGIDLNIEEWDQALHAKGTLAFLLQSSMIRYRDGK